MNPGDAAVMFILAAVLMQKKFYLNIVSKTLNGEAIPGIEEIQDLKTFRMIKELTGSGFPDLHKKFMESPVFLRQINDSLINELNDIVHRMVLAVMLKEKIGDKFYDV